MAVLWGGVGAASASLADFIRGADSAVRPSPGEALSAAAIALSSAGIDADVDSLSAACRRAPAFQRLLVALVESEVTRGSQAGPAESGQSSGEGRAGRAGPGLGVFTAAQEAIVELFSSLLGRCAL
jgi:hypothetical protein